MNYCHFIACSWGSGQSSFIFYSSSIGLDSSVFGVQYLSYISISSSLSIRYISVFHFFATSSLCLFSLSILSMSCLISLFRFFFLQQSLEHIPITKKRFVLSFSLRSLSLLTCQVVRTYVRLQSSLIPFDVFLRRTIKWMMMHIEKIAI